MVSFEMNADEQRRVDEVAAFVDEEVLPLEEKLSDRFLHEGRVITEDGNLHEDLLTLSRQVRRLSASRGFYPMHLPEEVGGAGMSRVGMLQANKAVFSRGLGLTLSVLANVEGPSRIFLALDEDMRRKYLQPLVRGEKTTAFALTEPNAGSDVASLETTAEKDGDEWVLNGTKRFITNGPYADFVVVFAKTDPDAGIYGGFTAFIVDKDTPGFRVGRTLETIANNGLPSELHFEDCRVPDENVIGGPGEGFFHAMDMINDLRVGLGGMCVGLGKFCLDRTLDYVTERKAFGKPVSKFQGVSFPLADCATELKAAEMLALNTAWLLDKGEGAVQETSMTKLYATETLWRVADRCIQAQGGMGTLREARIERILRWARVMRVFDGTSEIQRQTIAKTMGL